MAQHRLQEPSWPLTAEDVQLTGFIPLQSSWQTVQSPALVRFAADLVLAPSQCMCHL